MNRAGGVPGEAVQLLEEFLSAACDGGAGAALHALQSADAPLYRAGAWLPRSEQDASAFAAQHRELHAAGAAALPAFAAPRASAWEESDPGVGVLWFTADERRSGKTVHGALGLRLDLKLRVAWATLATREEPWGFAAGRAHTLANLAWMELREPAAARTTLDAAWFRLHWIPGGPLESLPGLRFSCRGSTSCCRQDYIVAMPAGAQALIDALPWKDIAPRLQGTILRPLTDGRVEIKGREEACRFIGPANECLIHATLGFQPFGPCASFPFYFTATPDSVEVSASRSCESVCEASGTTLAERDHDVRQRLAIASVRRTDAYRIAPEQPVDWPRFRDSEARLREFLGRSELPLHERLHRGLRFLDSPGLDGPGLDGPARESAPLEAPRVALDPALKRQLGDFLENIMRWDRLALRSLPSAIPLDLRHSEIKEPERIAAELVALHFSKVYSFEFDLTTAHNLAIVLYLLALAWQRALPAGLDALRRRELALLGSHGLLKSLLPADATPAFRALLGSPQFGEWALAFAEP